MILFRHKLPESRDEALEARTDFYCELYHGVAHRQPSGTSPRQGSAPECSDRSRQ